MKRSMLNERRILIALFIVFFLFRLINLTKLPIFNDEATYLDWSYRQLNIDGAFFHSVLHAKPPLYMWVVGLLRKIITNPLFAGRLVSVLAGSLAAFGLYKVAKELFNKKAGAIVFLLYTLIPIFTFFDRQALMESSISATGIWSLYFFFKLSKTKNIKYSLVIGIILGLGYLIKTSALVFFIAIFLLLAFESIMDKKNRNIFFTHIIILVSSYLVILSPLLFQSAFWQTLGDNKRYIFTVGEIIRLPFNQWFLNLKSFFIIVAVYFSPLVLLMGLASIFLNLKKRKTYVMYALLVFIVGVVFAIFADRNTGVRHTVSFLPIFLIFPAHFISKYLNKNKFQGMLLLLISIAVPVYITSMLIFKPLTYFDTLDKFTIHSQKEQYVTYWSSGYGFNEVKEYLDEISKRQKILVGVRLDAGIPENAVFTYYHGSRKVFPTYLDARLIKDYEQYDCLKSQVPIYFISRDNHMAGLEKHFTEIKKVYKPEELHYIGIHKLNEECEGNTLQLL